MNGTTYKTSKSENIQCNLELMYYNTFLDEKSLRVTKCQSRVVIQIYILVY